MTVCIYVPDIPEFAVLVHAAEAISGCRVQAPKQGYWRIEAQQALQFERKAMHLGPALWNSLLSGGFAGRISEYGRDRLVIESET